VRNERQSDLFAMNESKIAECRKLFIGRRPLGIGFEFSLNRPEFSVTRLRDQVNALVGER
jgi:hypothetical protein